MRKDYRNTNLKPLERKYFELSMGYGDGYKYGPESIKIILHIDENEQEILRIGLLEKFANSSQKISKN